jgi:hypothetical protein
MRQEQTMDDRFLLRAYWGPRKETIDKCADRLGQFLARIAVRSDSLAAWFEKSRSRRKATEKAIDSGKDGLMDLLRRCQNREDTTGDVIEDLGFHVALWNGRRGKEVSSLSIKCGMHCSVPGVGFNCVLLNLPEDLGTLANGVAMAQLFADTVESWEPERATVCSELAVDNRGFDARRPFVDWMVYVAELKIAATSVPDAADVRQVASGTMIVVEDGPENAIASEHLHKVVQIENAIRRVCV